MNRFFPMLAQASDEVTQFLDGTTAERVDGAAGTFWMPFSGATYAGDVDWAFYLIYWVSVFFTALIFFLMVFFTIRYRHKIGTATPAHKGGHSTTLELTWTIIPTIIVLVIFYFGFRSYLAQAVIPPDAYEIQVNGRMWSWDFTYPDGHVDSELHVPAGVPVRLVLTSQDVIHSFFVPAFRAKKDAVPGRYNKMWFQSDSPGRYQAFCAEYCGTSHSKMGAIVVVHPLEEDGSGIMPWAEWEEEARTFRYDIAPAELGKRLYTARGCNQCHTIDGSASRGPTWQNLFGSERQFTDGSSTVADENYIVEAITQPNARIVAGFGGIMPSYQGSLRSHEITGLIAYMKSISEHYKGPEVQWDVAETSESGQGTPAQDSSNEPATPQDEPTNGAQMNGAGEPAPDGAAAPADQQTQEPAQAPDAGNP